MKAIGVLNSLEKNSKVTTIAALVFIFLLFIDLFLSLITDVVSDFIKSPIGLALFSGLTILSLIGSYFVVNMVLRNFGRKKISNYSVQDGDANNSNNFVHPIDFLINRYIH